MWYNKTCQQEKILPPKESTKNEHYPKAINSGSKKSVLQKNPQARSKNPATRKKRKRANKKNPPNPKGAKSSSASEIHPLTMADILDIVAVVTDAN